MKQLTQPVEEIRKLCLGHFNFFQARIKNCAIPCCLISEVVQVQRHIAVLILILLLKLTLQTTARAGHLP